MKPLRAGVLSFLVFIALGAVLPATDRPYPIVDTGQVYCYNQQPLVPHPQAGEAFFGQDTHYEGLRPSYKDNGGGPKHHFSSLNTNGDGYLSEDEAPKGPPKGKR